MFCTTTDIWTSDEHPGLAAAAVAVAVAGGRIVRLGGDPGQLKIGPGYKKLL
jgi:hypothetical protein